MIRKAAPERNPNAPGNPENQAQVGAQLPRAHTMAAREESRGKGNEAVADKRGHAPANSHMDEGPARQQIGNHLLHRGLNGGRRIGCRLDRLGHAPGRLLHGKAHQNGQQKTGNAHHHEGPAPTEKFLHPAPDEEAKEDA